MVQVTWRKTALADLERFLEKAYLEYGATTMNRHISRIEEIEERLRNYPESFPPEPLLRGKRRKYRGAHILGRFEIIYYYAQSTQHVYVVSLWDTRRNPDMLIQTIR